MQLQKIFDPNVALVWRGRETLQCNYGDFAPCFTCRPFDFLAAKKVKRLKEGEKYIAVQWCNNICGF